MGFDLSKIGTAATGPGPGDGTPPQKGGFDLSKIPTTAVNGNPILGGAPTGLSFGDFRFQPKVNADNYLLRAQDQGVWEQAGKMLGNAAANSLTGLVEGFGYLPELFDDAHDYSNALTRKMQEWHNPFGEIYREHPDKMFDLSDPAWWFTNIQQLAESAGAFALEGVGLAKVFGTLARGAGELMTAGRMGLTGIKAASGTAQLASAATLAYTEGAMSGYQIYDAAYRKNYDKALSAGHSQQEADEIARRIAGNAAATTVRMNTIMNTVLNLGELAPLFKAPKDEVLHWLKTEGARQEGESLSRWATRFKTADFDHPDLKKLLLARHGWTSRAAEAAKEGIEEVNTQYAEHEGRRRADGENRDMFTALTDLDQYLSDVTDQEGALNFVLGSIGGVAQTALIDHIPARLVARYDKDNNPILKRDAEGKIVYDSKGKPRYEKKLVSARSYSEFGTRKYFENMKDAVLYDIDNQQKLQSDLLKATAAGNEAEAERIRGQIFSVGALDAVTKGLTGSWQKMYEEIEKLDNTQFLGDKLQPQIDEITQQLQQAVQQGDTETAEQLEKQRKTLLAQQVQIAEVTEAMQKGFAKDVNDNEYKKRARRAVEDLQYLQELHGHIQKKYVDPMNPTTGDLADHLFRRQADLYLGKRAIEQEEARITRMEELEAATDLPSANLFDAQVRKYNEHISVMNSAIQQLQDDLKALQEANEKGNVAVMKAMIAKYRAKGTSEDDMAGAVNDLGKKLGLKAKQYKLSIDEARKALEESLGYTTWAEQNPGKNFQDYTDKVGYNLMVRDARANLEAVKAQQEIAEQSFQELSDRKGHRQLMKALAEDKQKLIDDINKRTRDANVEAFLRQQNKRSAARLDARQKAILTDRSRSQVANLTKQLNEARQKKTELEREFKELLNKGRGLFSNLNKIVEHRLKLLDIRKDIARLEGQLQDANRNLSLLVDQAVDAQMKQARTEAQDDDELQGEDLNEDVPEVQQTEEPEYDPLNDKQQSGHKLEDLAAGEDEKLNEDPIQAYIDLKKTLPAEALPILDKLEQQFTGKKPSPQATFDAFRDMVRRGKIEQDQVNLAYLTLADYLKEKAKPVEPSPTELVTEEAPKQEEETSEGSGTLTTDDISPVIESGQPEVEINPEIFTPEGLSDMYWGDNAKTTDAVKANSSDLKYVTIEKDGQLLLRNETKDGAPVLDETANKDRMVPGVIDVGDDVILQIDTEWKGQINNDLVLDRDEGLHDIKVDDRFENYVDGQGKIRMQDHERGMGYENVPIKIIHEKTGKVIGYFPRVAWITSTQGAENYRNVEDLKPADAEGNREPGNVAEQVRRNRKVRKQLAEKFNQNPGAVLRTKVSGRTDGNIMFSGDLNKSTGQTEFRTIQATKVLPDPDLQLGVIGKRKLLIGKGQEFSGKPASFTPGRAERLNGAPVVLIPLPNGKVKVSPLKTTRFKDRQGDVYTIMRVIEIHLRSRQGLLTDDEKELVKQIREKTKTGRWYRARGKKVEERGFNLLKVADLRAFIEQYYTFTSNFSDDRTDANAKAINGKKIFKFMLQVKGDIKVGTSYSGKPAVYAQLKNGKLDVKFEHALREGFEARAKNVTFYDRFEKTEDNAQGEKEVVESMDITNGLNNQEPITEVRIYKQRDGTEKLWSKTHDSYNEYAKTFTYTPVYGLHQVDGRYVYAANSQVILDEHMTTVIPTPVESGRDLISTPAKETDNQQAPVEGGEVGIDYDSITNANIAPVSTTKIIQPEGDPLNLENLTRLYNFTPESNRNGKTPQEVLEHLNSLGITRIADGYNPFHECS